jgi:antitoxin (DNA-binding transcriptional repressor) of toxin-antitoxin stability system
MSSVTLAEAQARLPQLIAELPPGAAITITDQGQPVAQVKKVERTSWPCTAGSAAGKIRLAPDFDAPLEDFKEYME